MRKDPASVSGRLAGVRLARGRACALRRASRAAGGCGRCCRADDALDGDPAAVDLRDVLDDRQPQPGAAQVAAARLVDAVEPLEQPRQVLRRDAAPWSAR